MCLIIAALIVVLLPRPQSAAPAASPAAGAPSEPQVGRFQLGGIPGHAYVLDTATGQVWERFAEASGGGNDPDFNKPKLK